MLRGIWRIYTAGPEPSVLKRFREDLTVLRLWISTQQLCKKMLSFFLKMQIKSV